MTHSDDTHRPGNTNRTDVSRIRSRNWMITSFKDPFKSDDKAKYQVWCKDTCKDGRDHIHVVIVYSNPVSLNRVKGLYPTAHLEIVRNVFDAIQYIKGNANGRKYDVQEIGTEPNNTRFKTVGELKNVSNPNDLDWKQFNTWQKIHENDEIKIRDWKKKVEVIYIWGESKTGKSYRAEHIAEERGYEYFSNAKFDGSFWSGVGSNRKCLIYDDWRDSHMKASEFIHFIDYNRHNMNVKGGSCSNDYELIIITTTQDPNEIYPNVGSEPKRQWLRRMNIIHLTEVYNEEEETNEVEFDLMEWLKSQ